MKSRIFQREGEREGEIFFLNYNILRIKSSASSRKLNLKIKVVLYI